MLNKLTTWIAEAFRLPAMPSWLVAIIVIGVVASWVPLAVTFWGRNALSPEPRVHLIQDMDNQPRFEAQGYTVLFNDRRQMRPPVPGTVRQGGLQLDDHMYRGFEQKTNSETGEIETVYFSGLPKQIEPTERLMKLGEKKYNTYCFVCHGMTGAGDGPVNTRAVELATLDSNANSWVTAKNLNEQLDGALIYGPAAYPDGQLYNTINVGKGNMAGYGHQLTVEERWAIVFYMRALQLSQVGETVYNAKPKPPQQAPQPQDTSDTSDTQDTQQP